MNLHFSRAILFTVISISLLSCGTSNKFDEKDGLDLFSKDSLAARIKILSSDDFQGRRPFTEGENKSVEYIKTSFQAMGLEPGNGESYFQDVPMVEITPELAPTMTVQSSRQKFDLKKITDYVAWTENTDSSIALDNNEVIFAGYGVVAPEYNWNDYAGIDVKGKTVLVMVNDPGFGTSNKSIFKGDTMTYYGRWTYKFEEAARQGARAVFVIHNTVAASYPFSVVQNSWGTKQLHLDNRGSKQYICPIEGWITEETAKKIFAASGKDSTLFSQANQAGFKSIDLGLSFSTSMKVKAVYNNSKNVIAKITGTTKPDEYVIYTGHWDHFGIGKPDARGDSIYNGALDNASGTASVLEMARAFKNMKNKPGRTILFLSVTAEEQGLLGSKYYAEHPIYPIDKTVANINIDVINNIGKAKDITIVGAGQSELEDYLQKEAEASGRYISPEPHPEAGEFFRSDHFNFAKKGVPAITTSPGIDDVKNGKEYGRKKLDEYVANHYHQPSDEYDPGTWNLEGGIADLQLLFQVGKRLAFESAWPKWKPGSEFRPLRDK